VNSNRCITRPGPARPRGYNPRAVPRFLAVPLAVGLAALAASCSGGHAASQGTLRAACADFGAHPAAAATTLAAGAKAHPELRAAAGAYLSAVAAQALAAKLAQGDSGGYSMRHAQSLVALNRRLAAAAAQVRSACAVLG
jgi:hypothetical protein